MSESATLRVGVDPDADVLEELARIQVVYPGWRAWIGAGGSVAFAQREIARTSPPAIVSASDTAALWSKVREADGRCRREL